MSVNITEQVIAAFRAAFPAFSSEDPTTGWDDNTVTIALCEGDAETINGKRWGAFVLDDCRNMKRRGMFFYAAHYLASFHPNGQGSMSGAANNVVQSKSVGDESVTFAVGNIAAGSAADAWLSSTSFGQNYLRLRKRAGMGAIAC